MDSEIITPVAVKYPAENEVYVIEKPQLTRKELLQEMQRCYTALAKIKPPHEKELTMGQTRKWNVVMELHKAKIYALTACYPVLRDLSLTDLEAQVAAINKFIEESENK